METFWDWLTVFTFAGLVTLLLQRSAADPPKDKLWHYFPPAVGCAVVNYIGNEGHDLIAGILYLGVLAAIVFGLKVGLTTKGQ